MTSGAFICVGVSMHALLRIAGIHHAKVSTCTLDIDQSGIIRPKRIAAVTILATGFYPMELRQFILPREGRRNFVNASRTTYIHGITSSRSTHISRSLANIWPICGSCSWRYHRELAKRHAIKHQRHLQRHTRPTHTEIVTRSKSKWYRR